MNDDDLNDLAYWFPILATAGVPVPKTIIVPGSDDLMMVLDHELPPSWPTFVVALTKAAQQLGYPNQSVFLRTGWLSGKHSWRDTCAVEPGQDILRHVGRLVDESGCCGFLGLPVRSWAVREMLPVFPWFTAFAGDMPICTEARVFFADHKFVAHVRYWPDDAIMLPSVEDFAPSLAKMDDEIADALPLLRERTERVAALFNGAWSLDWLKASTGEWYAIDMALARCSWGCPDTLKEAPPA